MFKFLTQFFSEPKFKADFTDQATYDIACALRGPDLMLPYAKDAKWVLTARLRALVGLPANTHKWTGLGAVRYSQLTVKEASAFRDLLETEHEAWAHYARHLEVAFGWLRTPEQRNQSNPYTDLAMLATQLQYNSPRSITVEEIIQLAGGDPE